MTTTSDDPPQDPLPTSARASANSRVSSNKAKMHPTQVYRRGGNFLAKTPRLKQPEAARQPMHEDDDSDDEDSGEDDSRRQRFVDPPSLGWEQHYRQQYKIFLQDSQCRDFFETRAEWEKRVDVEYAAYLQQIERQKKYYEDNSKDISELTKGMKDMSIVQSGEEKVIESKQEGVAEQTPAQAVVDHTEDTGHGEEDIEDVGDWVVVD